MRVADIPATVRELYQSLVQEFNVPFNTTHYVAIGLSLGGAAAAGVLAVEESMLGAVNLDGLFVDTMDVKKPFLMLAGAQHTAEVDPSRLPFSKNQSG